MPTIHKRLESGLFDRTSRFTNSQSNWRQTIWPTSDAEGNVFTLGTPLRMNSFREQNQRWTGAFDPEARASRMSMLADHSLFPPPLRPQAQHEQWTGNNSRLRKTWLNSSTEDADPLPEHSWNGEFDVERRPSWVSRQSAMSQSSGELDEKANILFEVGWEKDDAENPLNFAKGRKWLNAMVLALAVFMVSIASSGFSQGEPILSAKSCLQY